MTGCAEMMMRNLPLVLVAIFDSCPFQDKRVLGQHCMQREAAAAPGLAKLAMTRIDGDLHVVEGAIGYGAATATTGKFHG